MNKRTTRLPETLRIAIAAGVAAAVEAMRAGVLEELAEVSMARILETHAHCAAVLVQVDSNHVAQVHVGTREEVIQFFEEHFPGEVER